MIQNQLSNKPTLKQKMIGIGSAASLVAFISILYTAQIQMLEQHTEPICTGCGSDYAKYELDWDNGLSWSAGALSQTYSNVDNSGTEFSFQYTGKTDILSNIGSGNTPNIQTYFTDGSVKSLSNYISPGFNGSKKIEIAVSINPPIPAQIGLDLYHINGSSDGGDKLQVYALAAGTGAIIYPSLTGVADKSWEDDGDGTADAIGFDDLIEEASVGVNFTSTSLIDQLVFVWTNCDMCGRGVHGFGIGNIEFYSNNAPLPIKWGDVQVKWEGTSSNLSWHTLQELNNDYFTVERSIDGKIYKNLGKVSAKGNSVELSEYKYEDKEANFTQKGDLYYRIKQIDLDGSFSYSSVVKLEARTNTMLNMKLFPNPANDYITAQLGDFEEIKYRYEIITPNGQLVQKGVFNGREDLKLNVQSLSVGTYQLIIHGGDATRTTKAFQIRRP